MFITPAVAGDRVFVGSCAGGFHAYDAATGEERWRYDTGRDGNPAQFHGDALVTDELVVVGSDTRPQGHLYAFERASGEVRWKLPFPGGVTAQVLGYRDTVLAVTVSGEVVAVELATGTPRWLVEGPEGTAGGRVHDPAVDGGRLFVGWAAGIFDAYDAATGELLWRRDLGTPINTSVAVFANEVVVGTLVEAGGQLVRLAPATGEELGRSDPGGAPYGDLVPAGDCLLTLTAEGGFDAAGGSAGGYALACSPEGLGAPRWHARSPDEWSTPRPLVRGREVVVGVTGRLLGLSLDDGRVRWERVIDGVPRSLGDSEQSLFVGALSGQVHALPLERR